MPTLIRLVIFLLFIAGLGYAGMFALAVMVDPGEKEIVTRIPARDFRPEASTNRPRPFVESEPAPPTNTQAAAPQNSQAPATAPQNTPAAAPQNATGNNAVTTVPAPAQDLPE